MEREPKTAYAALDIGTSQVKLGVYCPWQSGEIIPLGSLSNEVQYGPAGEVRAEYAPVREKSFRLLGELGRFAKENAVETLYVGTCGHVSSLLEWNRATGRPPDSPFPIWLDTTCYPRLAEYQAVMGGGRSQEIIGTFLPPGTNWLFTKLLHRRQTGFTADGVFLQVGDAVFYELTGTYHSHFSSQISLVDLRKRAYAPALTGHLQLPPGALPTLAGGAFPVGEAQKKAFGFPAASYAFPALADLYASLYGLRLGDGEGFMLANTSEQAGAFYREEPRVLDNFLHISFGGGFVNYGSTNTGGNVVNWFVNNVLRKEPTPDLLRELTGRAAAIPPEETPLALPYLQGERAPLWDSRLTASLLEVNSSHTDAHLFRALLESVAFARRQCFEALGLADLAVIKLGGGSSKNALWNAIRAGVLNKPVAVADEKELALAGVIYYAMEAAGSPFARPPIGFSV
ncbi:MAG TPA: FGGY-family carbohydrate kinase, partial [Cytophagales bacterium]